MKSNAIYIMLLFLSAQLTLAQTENWQFDFDHINNIKGANTHNDILITGATKDNNGLMWLSTLEGIFRYDGNSIFPFAKEKINEILPFSLNYHNMHIAPDGAIWLVNEERGTLEIPANERKTRTLVRTKIMTQKSAHFVDIIFTGDSSMWISSNDLGIHHYNKISNKWNHYYPQKEGLPELDPSFGNMQLENNRHNSIFINCHAGLYSFDIKQKEFEFYPFDFPIKNQNSAHFFKLYQIQNRILVGLPNNLGIKVFDISTKSWKQHLQNPTFETPHGSNVVSFMPMLDNKVLVGITPYERIGIITVTEDDTLKYDIKEYNLPTGSLNNTRLLIQSSKGQIHLCSNRGITHVSQRKNNFSFFRLTPRDSLKNNWQRSFLQLEDNNKFLLGTFRGDGLIEVDWLNRKKDFISYKAKPGPNNFDVTMVSLENDHKNKIWIGSDEGMLKADLHLKSIRKAPEFTKHPILNHAQIHFIKKVDSNLWISTKNKGIFTYQYPTSTIHQLFNDQYFTINQIVVAKNQIWLATNKGLKKLDIISDHTWATSPWPVTLDNIEIMDMIALGDMLWLTTQEDGLWSVQISDPENPEFQQYLNPEVARGNFLNKIIHRPNRNLLWLNSAAGFSSFDLSSHRFVNFLIDDGIGFSGRNGSVFHPLHDGTIIAGANRHFQFFHPDSLTKDLATPVTYVKEIIGDGLSYKSADFENDNIRIKANTHNIAIKMGAINFNHHPINYYSYRMIGLHNEWSPWSPEDNVNYSNLRGGNYPFEFKVANKLFEWEGIKKLNIQITKQYYETALFKLLICLSFGGLFFFSYKYWNNQKNIERNLREEYQTQINELQMNALQMQMNPHFVFNSINSINYYIIKNDRDLASNYLAKFSRLIRLILENSKEKLISLEKELEAIRLYLEIEQIRFEGKFSFEIEVDEQVHLSNTQIPPLIIQPYVENAIWHGLMHKTTPGTLIIKIRNMGDLVQCIIEDDGIGRAAAAKLDTGKGRRKQSLGTKITNNRLAYIEKIYGIKTLVETVDLKHMDGSAAGTRVLINTPKLNKIIS